MCFDLVCCFFFFKQKTAYEMRISDWSSDVCSSDLIETRGIQNVGDLSALAPGLQISKTASNSTISQITIRGLSQINPAIYWDPAVGVYVDGVYKIGRASCRERVCQYV